MPQCSGDIPVLWIYLGALGMSPLLWGCPVALGMFQDFYLEDNCLGYEPAPHRFPTKLLYMKLHRAGSF
ncbi:hypothetical protein BV898_05105 [Hypsibius exemplaris]|uniref:Uncharacterized protein n=1 Tax=Hypsibius exemplaris TaxID=2072580 RepID=A0A1W0X169_HYPEX|nr:hypothetical protein BV898_05105 [Hypsibius exemplaris]